MPSLSPGHSVSIIGSGAVANSLGVALLGAGFSIDGIVSASLSTARELGVRLGVGLASNDFADLPLESETVFVCVPDSAIQDVADRLASLKHVWNGRLVAHTSGAIHADALRSISELGADVLSFHPLQSFPSNGGVVSGLKSLQGIYIGLEGTDGAVQRGEEIVAALGAHSLRIPSEKKEAYHLAASVASNLFVAVVAMADEILAGNDLDSDAGARMFFPLIEGTLENLKRTSPERALTGPIARGDVLTVRKHLDALSKVTPHLLPAYASLSTEVVRLAVRGGQIGPSVAEDVLDTLQHALGTPDLGKSELPKKEHSREPGWSFVVRSFLAATSVCPISYLSSLRVTVRITAST